MTAATAFAPKDFRYTEWGIEGAAGRELYDVRVDPAEMKNLADSHSHEDDIKELSGVLRGRIEEANRPPKGVKQIKFDNKRHVPQRNS